MVPAVPDQPSAEMAEDVDVAAIAARAQAARRQAGGPGPAGDAAYRATVEEALRTFPAPFAQVARRVLTPRLAPTSPVPEVNLEALREEYAEGEADHDRNPTEAGFVAWLAGRAGPTGPAQGGAVLLRTYEQASRLGAFRLARRWCEAVPVIGGLACHVDELATMAALRSWLGRWLPMQVHRVLACGGTVQAVVEATGLPAADLARQWRGWSAGQRWLHDTVPGAVGFDGAAHDRVAALFDSEMTS